MFFKSCSNWQNSKIAHYLFCYEFSSFPTLKNRIGIVGIGNVSLASIDIVGSVGGISGCLIVNCTFSFKFTSVKTLSSVKHNFCKVCQLTLLKKPDTFVSCDFLSFSTLKILNSQTTRAVRAKSIGKPLKIIF